MTRALHYFLLATTFTIASVSCTGVPAEKDAYLSGIDLSAGETSPNFHPQTKDYSIQVSCAIDNLDVSAYPAYSGVTSIIREVENGLIRPVTVPIIYGENTITIDVDGELYISTIYTLTVTRGGALTAPAISLNGPALQTWTKGVDYVESATACSGTGETEFITSAIKINGEVDKAIEGVYTLTYNVTDTDGNGRLAEQIIRIVTVVSNTAPVLTLLGNATETVIQNAEYTDAGASAADEQEGDISTGIVTTGAVIDTKIIDTYTVTYNVVDMGGLKDTITRSVEVIVAP